MHVHELWIEEFKNLRDIEVDFDKESPYTVLVGGKRVLESRTS